MAEEELLLVVTGELLLERGMEDEDIATELDATELREDELDEVVAPEPSLSKVAILCGSTYKVTAPLFTLVVPP